MNRLVCSRFDTRIPNASNINKTLIRLSTHKEKEHRDFYCISTNGCEVFDGKRYTLEKFFKKYLASKKALLVLTDKEAFYLTRWCVAFGLKVTSFESEFPIFDNIKFTYNLEKNYDVLKRRLAYVRKIGLSQSSLASTLSERATRILKRKLKFKTSYDELFAHAYNPPYQEAFKLFDFRQGRAIISLDFNSMFADCMVGEFLDPEGIYFESTNAVLNQSSERMNPGLYHVILKRPNSPFFKHYHPFKFAQLGLSLKFSANNTTEIETQLFHFELDYYKKFFDEVYVVSALRSKSVVGHPLYNESRRLYKLRSRAKAANKKFLEKSYKLQLAMLHSATNRRAEKKACYNSFSELLTSLNKNLHLTLDENIPYLIKSSPLLKKINVTSNGDQIITSQLDLNSTGSIFSFSSQVIAKSRLKMFQTLESFNRFNELDICYVNTDSVHVSIPVIREQEFFKTYSNLIGPGIGKLKVQSVADNAAWFDVGRYFLFKNGKVIQWANFSLNHKGNNRPFLNYREMYKGVKIDDCIFLSKYKITFLSSLSYKKRLLKNDIGDSKSIDYRRFTVDEINSFDNAMLNILEEKQASHSIKRHLYDLIRYNSKRS
tara:strand:+ start:5218 stop:7023 length:1806 start_codon:yes stop_codon:yes gene_type:complete